MQKTMAGFLAGCILAACGSAGSASTKDASSAPTPPAVAQVYAHIGSSIQSHVGKVLHITSTGTNSLNAGSALNIDLYIDIANSMAREDVRGSGAAQGSSIWFGQASTVIQVPGGKTNTAAPVACDGMTTLVAIALGCEDAESASETTLEVTSDGGTVLVTTASVHQATQLDPSCGGTDCPAIKFTKSYTRRITLDASTFLPTAIDEQGNMDIGNGVDYKIHKEVATEFVGRGKYDEGFFAPPQD